MNACKFFIAAAFLVATGFLVSCEVNDSTVNDTGRLTVQLTDAPGNYEAVYVDIQKVRIIRADAEATDDSANWITLNDEPVRVDLLQLRNGKTMQLGEHELQAGMYNQIRLVLGNDNDVIVNGDSYALDTPSAQQSGLKLNINANIKEGEHYNLLIDFDAARSIIETGNGNFILKPGLRAVNLEETGSIGGTVQPSDFETTVMAIAGDDTLSSITTSDGYFNIAGVKEGTYNVELRPNSSTYSDTTIANVSVPFNEDVDLGKINLKQ